MSSDPTGCCASTPDAGAEERRRENPPGLGELRTRRGEHADFKARMLAALSTTLSPPDGDPTTARRPLRALGTRADDDATIAIIDAWAVACDVLAFYQERIQNEQYLGTATERDSVVRIARMLGYEPSPGVAASVRLALTIDEAGAAPEVVEIDAGLAVMSVPGQDEMPQTFETTEAVQARAEWNALAPRSTRPQQLQAGDDELWLEGVGTRLEPGQTLLVAEGARRTGTAGATLLVTVTEVEASREDDRTRVVFSPPLQAGDAGDTWVDPFVLVFRSNAGVFGWNAPDYRALSADLKGAFETANPVEQLSAVTVLPVGEPGEATLNAYVMPLFRFGEPDWPGLDKLGNDGIIDLDRESDKLPPGSFVALRSGDTDVVGRVQSTRTVSRVDYTLSARVTRVTIDVDDLTDLSVRSTAVLLQSEELPLAQAPFDNPVQGSSVELAVGIPPVQPGHILLIEGLAAGAEDEEPVVLQLEVADFDGSDPDHSLLGFTSEIDPPLARDSVVLYGNTVPATHGRSVVDEVLGSGDATQANARYPLRQAPLTWVAAGNARGAESTLELRVGGVLWQRVDSLYDAGPTDRVYVLQTQEDGSTVVVFGDGLRGARVPTGTDNIVVSYRVDMGIEGEVDRGQLTLLQSRPLGLKGVNNPGDASGAADAESLDDARQSAPLTVLTLDRLVSLSDYEDFARAFAGIGKARASRLWDGRRAFVHLTVASASGEVLAADGETMASLRQAITSLRDPAHVVRVDPHIEVPFGITLSLTIQEDRVREEVEEEVRAALADAFGFQERQFGQPVAASEVTAVVHGVDGVVAVDVDALTRLDTGEEDPTLLTASLASWTGSTTSSAELLTLDESQVSIGVMST